MSFPTGEQVYDRLRWDERFDLDRIQVVFSVRPKGGAKRDPAQTGTKVVPYREFDTSTIPWHRIVEFRLDGETIWSRPDRIDRIAELAQRSGFRRSDAGGDVERVPPAPLLLQPLAAHRHDGTAWVPSSGLGAPDARATLRVVTWNVLFDRFDAELLDSERRWDALLRELETVDADLIALQEVTPALLGRLLGSEWVRRGFHVSDGAGAASVHPHGQVLLSRHPIRGCALSSFAPHRRVLWARVDVGGLDVGVCVVHLASNRTAGARAARAEELRAVLGHIAAETRGAWLVLGDFNAGEDEHGALLRGASAQDAWRAVRPGDAGLTFDVERNALAGALSESMRSGRFDRVLSLPGAVARLVPTAARLRGESPADGRFHSDHFGVEVELAIERAPAADLAAAPGSKRAALVLLPPTPLWGPLQRLRCRFDRGYARWPPHVTLLYEFVDPAWLDAAARSIEALLEGRRPFEVAFDRPERFEQAAETTLVLEASGAGRAALASLRGELLALFPQLTGGREFRPHLTVARVAKGSREGAAVMREIEAVAPSMNWTADRVALLVRREADAPFELSRECFFDPGPRPLPVASGEDRVDRLRERVAEEAQRLAGREVPVIPFGSSRYAPPVAADLDLLVVAGRRSVQDAQAFATSLSLSLVQPDRDSLRRVDGDGFLSLRGGIGGREVDLTLVFVDGIDAADDRALPEGARRALLGARDADVLVERLRRHGRYEVFLRLLPLVRQWVRARAIGSNAFGYTSSFGWALLVAPPLLHDARLCSMPAHLALPAWFEWLAALPAGADVTLEPGLETDEAKRLRIRSPAAPYRNAARSFTRSTEAVLRQEFALAARRTREVRSSADALARAALPLEEDGLVDATIAISGPADERGPYEGAFLSLLLELERADLSALRPWGRVDLTETGGWTHRIGVRSADRERACQLARAWIERAFPALRADGE